MKTATKLLLASVLAIGSLGVSAKNSLAIDYSDLAGHWSPVVFQDTAIKDGNVSQDFITNFNFDGNYNAYDNWENQPKFPNPGYIYFAVAETQTHYYIMYSFFHPRDWEQICTGLFTECHENDGEQIRLVVAKDGTTYGTLQVMETQAHGGLDSHKPSGSPVTNGKKSVDTDVSFESSSHVRIFVEAHGHGPYPCDSRCTDFPGGDGVVYRFKGNAEVPAGANDSDVGYDLIDEASDLWLRRHESGNGTPFIKVAQYSGVRLGAVGKPIGFEFGGDTYGNGGHTTWGWGGEGVNGGDWMIDAAYVAQLWYTIPNENDPGFLTYTFNRYLDDLKAESSTGGGGGGGVDTGGGGCTMVRGAEGSSSLIFLLLVFGLFALRRHRAD